MLTFDTELDNTVTVQRVARGLTSSRWS